MGAKIVLKYRREVANRWPTNHPEDYGKENQKGSNPFKLSGESFNGMDASQLWAGVHSPSPFSERHGACGGDVSAQEPKQGQELNLEKEALLQ